MSHNLKDIQDQAEKYSLLKERVYKEKKEPSIFYNEDNYTDQDWAEIRMANETKKYNPEGQKIRQKIISELKGEKQNKKDIFEAYDTIKKILPEVKNGDINNNE